MTDALQPGSPARRVAVISDIHANLAALEAVLEEINRERPDRIVVCGDVASGPSPAATIERLRDLGERAVFIRGNGDREIVTAFDDRLPFDPNESNAARLFAAWAAQRINRRQRDFLATFKERIVLEIAGLGNVIFCHGTPHSDEEIITRLTPLSCFEKFFAGFSEQILVCGHTHHQFDLKTDRQRAINAGSVGMPYEGKPGAYWALLGPEVNFRRTEYDLKQALEEATSAGYPDHSYSEILLTPPTANEVAMFFEQAALDRGERS